MRLRALFLFTLIMTLPPMPLVAQEPAAPSADEAAVWAVVQTYVNAREAKDPKAIEALFMEDADQLVSDGTWRRGRDTLVRGMLESSRRNPARWSITVESVRFLAPEGALVDGRYIRKEAEGGKDRPMWTSITWKRVAGGWRIAAIRNMLLSAEPPRERGGGREPGAGGPGQPAAGVSGPRR